ncbi:MAG: type VI secretion system contractile sheath large subunit [Gammaproteobacteria bacterium]|nr:type VI secretion system contractile sheath large subunit [Gammaproteobacteria bacterium]MDE0479955.1 type VI secretion system contractile sheath large subunit [Gammaproteobacteria bacterium]MDE0507508.1 type VI secretion system contractile sheath large subunit [Gammaproteobacteria bacterium]MXX06145.1 type VI secretion system contractile sheath large subunit [Gammaproteobacteria bacterium]MXY89158.1 type VI secretion system contractile sheath large subunit [Gammaproteobacteria bacterium]
MARGKTGANVAGVESDTLLGQIFEDGRLVRDAHQIDSARNMLEGFLEEAAKAGTKIDGGAKRAIAERIVAIDKLITAQVNEVLHHEKFQNLEASWRNLHKLVTENELSSTLRVRVMNVTQSELERDFSRAPGFDQSHFFKRIYEDEYGTLGGTPYSFLIGDMSFGRSPKDIQFLRNMASVAAMSHAPFVASADPRLLDLDSYTELDRPIDIGKVFDASEMAAWNSLRDNPDSRYLVLTMPRTLVRLPWGQDAQEVEELDFEEDVSGDDHDKYLWGPSSWSMGSLIMKSFSESGWPAAIRGTETGGKVANLPLHSFKSLSGTMITKCPTETAVTDRREKELSDQGLISLCHSRNTDYAVVFSGATVNRPQKFIDDEANANARLSASLPYVLACARFAHYLKAIMRDKVGGFTSGAEVERFLNNWIAQYVTSDDSASHATKSRYPLREARVEVRDIPGKPGSYTAIAHLLPHFMLEELTASLRLVAELPN